MRGITLRQFLSTGLVLNDRGKSVQWCPALEELSAIERPEVKSVALCMPRRSGKSTCSSSVSLWHALTVPHAEVVLVAATGGSVEEIFRQKIVTSLLGGRFKKAGIACEVTKTRVYFPSVNSTILCIPPTEANVVGKSISLLVVDECRLVDSETIALLEPSTFAIGKRIFIGTAGRPRTWWEEQFRDPSPSHHSRIFTSVSDAANPGLDIREEAEAARRRAERGGNYQLMLYRRDFESTFCELAESPLLVPADVDRASREAVDPFDAARDTVVLAADLSVSRDLTTLLALARRDDADGGPLRVLEVFTLAPAASGSRVDLSAVEAKLRDMWKRYSARQVLVDQYQAVQLAQRLEDEGCPVKPVAISAPINQAVFSQLAEALSAGRLTWQRHERLERELLGLSIEETAAGFRILDGSKRFHRDVSFALALALWGITQIQRSDVLPVTAVGMGTPRERNARVWARERGSYRDPRCDPGPAVGASTGLGWANFFRRS